MILNTLIISTQFVFGPQSANELWSHSASLDASKNRILFYGGRDAAHNSLNTYFLFDTELHQLTPVKNGNPSMSSRHWHTSIYANQKVYIFGGESSFNCTYSGPFTDVWEATVNNSLETASFMPLASMPLGVMRAAGGFHTGLQRIFIVGGQVTRTDTAPMFTRMTQIYDPATNLWITFPNSIPTEMAGGSLIYHPTHNNLFLVGTFYLNGDPTNRILKWENNSWIDVQITFNGINYIPVNGVYLYTNYAIHGFFGGNSATSFVNCTLNTAYSNSDVVRVALDTLGNSALITLEGVYNTLSGRGDLVGAFIPWQDAIILHGGTPTGQLVRALPNYSAVIEYGFSSPGMFYNWIIPPRIGSIYFVEIVTNPVIQGGDAFMFWGEQSAPTNYNGATIFINPTLALNYLGQTSAQGKVSWSVAIPNNPVFVGLTFSNQVLLIKNSVYKSTRPIISIMR